MSMTVDHLSFDLLLLLVVSVLSVHLQVYLLVHKEGENSNKKIVGVQRSADLGMFERSKK
jgi:hypothetical protein